MSKRVSILMPMRNAEGYIKASIESILNQTYADLEVIIIDDCSTDSSREIVESFSDSRIKLLKGEGQGISCALNLGLEVATGDYVCRCDADDLYPVNRLSSQVDWLLTHPELIAVSGKFTSIDENGRIVAEFKTGDEPCDITSELNSGVTRTHLGTFLMKTASMRMLGGFRSYFVTAEDIDMQLRLAEISAIGYLPENMYFYRIHNSSITHQQSSSRRIFYEKQAREFLKQRQNDGQDLLELGQPLDPPTGKDEPVDSSHQIMGYLIAESWRLHARKHKKEALLVSLKACFRSPFHWVAWKNIIMIMLKK